MTLSNIKFAGDGAWGVGVGRPLTKAEADGNIYELKTAIQDLIDNPTPGVSLQNIAVSGRRVTFYLSDNSTIGPFNLPMATPRYRGVWSGNINYASFDIVRVSGFGTYMVVQDHTSAATFDPYVADSDGLFYVQIGPDPYFTSQVLGVSDATLTLALTHQNKYIRASNVAGLAVTLPANVFPANAEIHFCQASAGPVTITAGGGVTINVPTGYDAATGGQGSVVTIKRVGTNQWDMFGKLATVTA